MDVSPRLTQKVLQTQAQIFQEELGKLSIDLKINNQPQTIALTSPEITNIAAFFFTRMFGASARQRVDSLLKFLDQTPQDNIDVKAAKRAEQFSYDASLPSPVRNFFIFFTKYKNRSISTSSVYQQIYSAWDSYKLYDCFEQMVAMKDNSAVLQEFLLENGLELSSGQGVNTAIIEYLSRILQVSHLAIRNLLYKFHGIHMLVKEFGPGILVFLPPTTANLYVN